MPESWDGSSDDADDHIGWRYDSSDLKDDSTNDENALAEMLNNLENDLENDFSNNENALAEMIDNLENDSSDLKNKGICSEQSDHVEEGAGNNLHLAPQNSTLGGPRKKLLVMGLGGLLCHRVCKRDVSDIPRSRHPDAFYGSILVYKRPFCEEFMKFCLDKFEVGIWSSAKEWYLDSALDCIMKGLKSKLLFAWDQVECSDSGFKSLENTKKPIFFKEFNKLQKFSIQYSATNTLLIDDNPYKALLNPPHTAIFPNEYKTDQVGDAALGPGGDLRLYLEGLADAEDVPSYVKEHPFGQLAITPLHSDWEFYSGVVRHFQKE